MTRDDHSDDALEQATKLLRETEPAEFPLDAIARHMRVRLQTERRMQSESEPPAKQQTPPARMQIRRLSFVSRIAASILLGLGLLGILWVLFRSSPVIAFSLTADRLHQIQTLTANVTASASGMELHGTFAYSAPGKVRMAIPGVPVEVADLNLGKIVLLNNVDHSASVLDLDDTPSDLRRSEIDWIEKLRNVSHDAGKQLDVATINGVRAAKFSVTDDGHEIFVWSDIATGEPIRVEISFANGKETMTMTLDHLVINPPVDEQQFNVNIPAGYTSQSTHISIAPASEADLIRMFKEFVERTGKFPVSLVDFRKSLQVLAGASSRPASPERSLLEMVSVTTRAVLFLNELPRSGWHYNPAAKPGNASDLVFWYRTKDAPRYTIIHGDYRIEQASVEPNVPGAETPVFAK